jgi:ATP-dependent DNA helicase RecG
MCEQWLVGHVYCQAVTITDADLAVLADDMERDYVVRKASMADKEKIGQTICAFANDLPDRGRPGVLLIGVLDDGRPAGLSVTDRMQQELADYRSNGLILPLPVMSVERRSLAGYEVAVVAVQPSRIPPVRYRGQIWVRVGPRRAVASAEEERLLNERRRRFDLPFDARSCPGAQLDDLDQTVFVRAYLPAAIDPDVLAQNGRTVTERLMSLRFATADGVPTVAGIIVLGTDPPQWIPGAYVQFLRIAGHELSDPIQDEKRIDGSMIDILRQLDELLRLNITSSVDIVSGDRERRSPDFPLAALQQLVRNAVMHRDYEISTAPVRITWYADRVEILSPGGPYGSVTPENFGRPGLTDYRNPVVAEAMRALGYVQRFGAGIPIATRSMADNGNPPIEFDVTPSYVSVIVRRKS